MMGRGALLSIATLALVSVALAQAPATAPAPAPAAGSVEEVASVLAAFDRAYEGKDIDAIGKLVAPGTAAVFLMGDVADRWEGWAAIKAGLSVEFRRFKSIKLEPRPPRVQVRGTIAWFERFVVLEHASPDGESSVLARTTGVLERQEGGWRLVQYHLSVGPPRDTPRE